MNNSVAKKLRAMCWDLVPLNNIVGRNLYRHSKRCHTKKIEPQTLDFYIDRYEKLHNLMDANKRLKQVGYLNGKAKTTRIL